MKNLTIDQAHMLFTVFLAQNADKKVSEFVADAEEYQRYDSDVSLDSLKFVRNVDFICAGTSVAQVFWYDIECSFEVNMFNGNNRWRPFDIMKHISLEDKI